MEFNLASTGAKRNDDDDDDDDDESEFSEKWDPCSQNFSYSL